MISLKRLSQHEKIGTFTIVILGEKAAQASLPQGLRDTIQMLDLKPGNVETLKASEAGRLITTLYACLPEELGYDALEELTADLVKHLK